jgi:hypothetical protein
MDANCDENFTPTPEQIEQALSDDPSDVEELAVLSTPEEKAIGAKLLPGLTAKIRAQAQADSAKELAAKVAELQANNTRMMEDEIKKLRESIKPPDPKQIETLLSQDYGEMTVAITGRKSAGTRTFTLRELPQASEKQMFDIIQKRVLPHLKELAAVEWAAAATQGEKLQKVLTIIPDGLDMLAECCAICLDPFKEEGITLEWVQANMGSSRILNVVEAQLEVSKIRDFGSAVYRLFPQ